MTRWKLVPEEMNYEMGEASIGTLGSDDDRLPPEIIIDVWNAALAASPAFSPTDAQVERVARGVFECWRERMDLRGKYDGAKSFEELSPRERAFGMAQAAAAIAAFLKAVAEG